MSAPASSSGRSSAPREGGDPLRDQLRRILDTIASGFEAALLTGELETQLRQLYVLLAGRGYSTAAEKARLLEGYVHALRVRVVSLRSTRGLGRARDEIIRGLASIESIVSGTSLGGHARGGVYRRLV